MSSRWDQIAESLRRRIRAVVTVRGIAWLGLVTVVSLWTFGLADWLCRFDASWPRLFGLLGVVATTATVAWRTLWRPLSTKLTDVDVARTIERRFPEWGERLSSAAQFRQEQFAERLGSPGLQQVATADIDRQLGDVELDRVVDEQSTRRLAWTAAVIVVLGVGAGLWQRTAAATALTRLALPFADVQWPRTTELRFLNADLQPLEDQRQRTAAGEPLSLYLENVLGGLPDDATLQLRLPDGDEQSRALQTTVLRDEEGMSHEVGIATLTAHTGPIAFRALGGDDRGTPWHMLEVVPSPSVANLTMTLTPPAYVAQPPRVLDGAGAVEALVGSRIEIAGQTNTPLARALLRREGQPPQKMTLTETGRGFAVSFTVEQAGPSWYWFDIADVEGLSPANPPRYELRGIADRKPTVFIDHPEEDVTVTADADLPLRVIARDDLGLNDLRLIHSQPDAVQAEIPLPLSSERATEETVETVWNLGPLGLSAGDRLTYHAEAVDAFHLPKELRRESESADPHAESRVIASSGVGQVGISAQRHILILSDEDKRRELAARQLGVLDTLQEVEDRQSQALESTAGLRIQSELTDRLPADDLDLLKQTELEQHSLRERLTDERSGARVEVERLQKELERNHIDDPQMVDRLQALAEDLRSLTEEMLPSVEQALARARKLSAPDAARSIEDETSQQLRQAEQAQSSALALLKQATTQLGGWRQQYEVTSEVDDLISSQSDVHQQTQVVGRDTLTKRPEELSRQEQADLARLSDRQRRLARQLEELLHRGKSDSDDRESVDEAQRTKGTEGVVDALKRLGERDTLDQMHQAAESLRRNDIARTAEAQQQVLRDLRSFGELLQAGDEQASESLLSAIEKQAEEVETLKKRQEELAERSQQLMEPTTDPARREQLQRLIKEQEQLAEQAEDLARELRRQQRQQSAQSAARAGRRMREAQRAIEQQQPQETADSQQEALDDLTQLAGELDQQQREIEREVARQRVEQLSQEMQLLADEQESVASSTVELDVMQRERGSWSRSLRRKLRDVIDAQAELADRLDELRQSLAEYPVIELSLVQAAEPMQSAVSRLEDDDAGAATVERQRTAHQRLLALVEATQQANEQQQAAGVDGPRQNSQQLPEGQEPQVPQLLATQLRLLRHLQSDVQQRTSALAKRLESDEADREEMRNERESLTRAQGRIAELTQELLAEFAKQSVEKPVNEPGQEKQP